MASINSLMGSRSSTSSIFGNKNVISGLASGMDTESMIENAVSGYKMKISKLQQQRMKMEWQQTAYRSIIDKMVRFNQKYLSYSSGNNLMSGSFFDSAVKMVANGANANKVSTTGRTSSNVVINEISSLATSQKYSVTSNAGSMRPSNEAATSFDITAEKDVGTLKGNLTLGYGGKTVSISFNEKDVFTSADEMAKAINEKLEKATITFDGGEQVKASERIRAVVKDDKTIAFENVNNDGNGVWIDSASTSVEKALGIDTSGDKKDLTTFTFDSTKVTEKKSTVDVLNEKGFTITLNGVSKTVKGPTKDELGSNWTDADYIKKLQEKIDQEFGPGKLKVEDLNADQDGKQIQLKFSSASTDPNNNDRFEVTSAAGKLIGMENGLSSHINTSRKLGDLLQDTAWGQNGLTPIQVANADVTADADGVHGVDKDGNRVKKVGNDWHRVDKDDNELYAFEMNGKTVGTFSKESKLRDVIDQINKSEDAPYKVTYSSFTNGFVFEAKETGETEPLKLGGGLAEALFGKIDENTTPMETGKNAKFSVTVNGVEKTVEQASNTIEIDGMTVTMKDTFAAGEEKITFSTASDSDKVVEVVKTMVEDYNAMVKEIKDSYSTMPLLNSKGNYYEPLTDEDRAEMSESAIKAYEEKAKTGLLFADRELSNLYRDMTSALGVLGVSGNDALELGLTTSYENGATTLAFDEEKFRKALETDPDKVKKIFTGSVENGDASNGMMYGIRNQMEKYAGTMGAVKGILIEKAGSPLAPTTILKNTMQQKLDGLDKQVEALRGKMSKQVDYYNRKFTVLEQLVMQMNNQSSTLMGMMGGF